MTRDEQEHFVRSLCRAIEAEVINTIVIGTLPEDWDGHELRALLAEKFADSARMSLILREKRSMRTRNYKNAVIVNNL